MWNAKEYLRQITEGSEQSINRNIVECKVEHGDIIIRSIPGINRNIVECKDALQSQLANCCCGINRNIVECKEELYNKGLVGTDGINRNIVECKVNTFSLEAHDIIVLIETLWNVKYFPLTI